MRKRGRSFRHFRVAVLRCEDGDLRTLLRQFTRLGIDATCHDAFPPLDALQDAEAIFFDGDVSLPSGKFPETAWPDAPLIALVGSEAPSRLEWILAQGISAYLIKPVRAVGVLTALEVACREFHLRRTLRAAIERLEERLQGRRFVFSAQLALMREHGLSETEAFAHLRRLAMEKRTTIETVSIDLLSGVHSPRRAFG